MKSWNIAVVSPIWTKAASTSLKNALLYADHVHWISAHLITPALGKLCEELASEMDRRGLPREPVVEPRNRSLFQLRNEASEAFVSELFRSGADSFVIQHLSAEESYLALSGLIHDELRKACPLSRSIDLLIQKHIREALTDSRTLITNDLSTDRAPLIWNAYEAAQYLINSVARLLLPDVSTLPLAELVELRHAMRDSLDPMRAEVLRFTEVLRDLVSENTEDLRIQAEADNLVATRIEPVIREAAQHARDLTDKKWKTLFLNATKAFGLTGAAFVNHTLLAKAVEKSLETASLVFADAEDPTAQPRATATFVLRAQAQLDKDK